MMKTISAQLFRSNFAKFVIIFFTGLTLWWITIWFRGLTSGIENNAFTLIYPFLSLIGGASGLIAAKKWGGFGSLLGRSISFFSIGLLAQFFGQASYAYYIYLAGVEVPYPSIGDLGYFGSIGFYILGIIYLAKVAGVKVSLKSFSNKLISLVIPLGMLVISYWFFLRDYEFDWSAPLRIFLDFGYPLGQAIYISIAILAFILSRNVLGGIMRGSILFMISALIIQYISDYTFLYQAYHETWYVGGINDFMYATSYFVMTLSLINIGQMFNKIKES